MIELVRYHFKQYFKTNKYIMPFTILIAITNIIYMNKPVGLMDSFMVVSVLIFLVTSWIGVTACDVENEVSEQIMILRIQSSKKYYWSQVLFLLGLSAMAALVVLGLMLSINVVDGWHLFDTIGMEDDVFQGVRSRALTIGDSISMFVLWVLTGYVGCNLGGIAHPRLMKERNNGVFIVAFLVALTLAQLQIVRQFPWTEFLKWILPPITGMIMRFSGKAYFSLSPILISIVTLFLYGTLLACIRITVLEKRKF